MFNIPPLIVIENPWWFVLIAPAFAGFFNSGISPVCDGGTSRPIASLVIAKRLVVPPHTITVIDIDHHH